MARFTYIALVCAHPGQEEAFDRWYDDRHLPDVARMPGVVGARRSTVEWTQSNTGETPPWRSMAVYDLDCADPQATIAAIRAAAGTSQMPLSDAMDKTGMLQIYGRDCPQIG